MMNELRVARFTLHALLCLVFVSTTCAFGQEKNEESTKNEVSVQLVTKTAEQPQVEVRESATFSEDLTAPENVTLDFKEADIHNVLKIISFKSGINIVTTPDVMGNVTIRLVDVPWDLALDVMLKTYGYGYQKQGNIILVSRLENIAKIQLEEVLQTEIFHLKFIDAADAQKVLLPLLSKRGAVSILYTRGQKGWEYGTYQIGKERVEAAPLEKEATGAEGVQRSKTLLITDTASSLDRIRTVILPQIDSRPKQVLIETRFMEVNKDKLRDLGVNWGLGSTGAESTDIAGIKANEVVVSRDKANAPASQLGGNSVSRLGSTVASAFTGVTTGFPYNVGANLLFQKFTGVKFEAMLHALEVDADTNTLSAPRILTLDNQEASIMVGYHTPIFKTDVSNSSTTTGTSAATITQTLDYYQEIGIKLFVVPQVNVDGYINMILHPSVTSSTRTEKAQIIATGIATPVTTAYPVIDVRETQTQVLLKDGETVVIGGLLKDEDGKGTQGIPFLENIPLLGGLFRRDTYIKKKIDLLIFITARVINEGEFTEEEMVRLKENLGKEEEEIVAMDKRKKKRKVSVKINNATPSSK